MTLTAEQRAAIAAGTPLPIGAAGTIRLVIRATGLLLALMLTVPLHFLWRLLRL